VISAEELPEKRLHRAERRSHRVEQRRVFAPPNAPARCLPHVNADGSLCLHVQGEWQPWMYMADNFVPWITQSQDAAPSDHQSCGAPRGLPTVQVLFEVEEKIRAWMPSSVAPRNSSGSVLDCLTIASSDRC